jgi:hypothetical protein
MAAVTVHDDHFGGTKESTTGAARESRMNPVCFRRTIVMVLLAGLVGASGAARFGAVIENGHAEGRVTAGAPGRPGRWRELLPADPGLVAVLRLTVAVLVVTVVLWALR